jgi:hypothetical protein
MYQYRNWRIKKQYKNGVNNIRKSSNNTLKKLKRITKIQYHIMVEDIIIIRINKYKKRYYNIIKQFNVILNMLMLIIIEE